MKIALAGGTAILLLGMALAVHQYRTDLEEAHRRLLDGSRLAETSCGPVEYADRGTGPAVLLVHGAGGGYAQVGALGQWLADAGLRPVAVSRFGYLRTPLPADASPVAQADAHACLLDALDIDRAAVVGLSAGAPSAIQFCLRHPRRCSALALLVPAIPVPGRAVADTTPPSRFWQFVYERVLHSDFTLWAITRLWPELLVETVLATPLQVFREAPPAERRRALDVIRDIFPVSVKADGLRNDAHMTTTAPIEGLHRISAPTLAISAQDDLYRTDGGARHVAAQIVAARLLLFESGGHAWLGHDAEVRRELLGFLRGSAPLD